MPRQDCKRTFPRILLTYMIKEKIPELQRLSRAEKFALAIELWVRAPAGGAGLAHNPAAAGL
jgi:hypothetical protein